ncbi:MAG: MerR family transcriptional regulator [Oscillospiraceae bacterium]|nr:MerR family transcriptional regulator [Oscillospiraceae bacterium]
MENVSAQEKVYSIGAVCEEIKKRGFKEFENHNLRYLEKVLKEIITIRRDQYFNRIYYIDDIDKIEKILNLKEQGLNYNAIKSMLSAEENKDINSKILEDVEITYKDEIAYGEEKEETSIETRSEYVDEFKNVMHKIISSSLESSITPKIEEIKLEINKLHDQNVDLKNALETQQNNHYKALDDKLMKWREESFNVDKKKESSFLRRLFHK